MPRPPRNDLAVKQFSKAVAKLSRQKPTTLRDIERWTLRHADFENVSRSTLHNAITGNIDPTGCQVEVLLVTAAYFEVAPSELGSFAADRIAEVMAFGGNLPPEQGQRPSGWISGTVDASARIRTRPLRLAS